MSDQFLLPDSTALSSRMMSRYLAIPGVQRWLFNRAPTPPTNALSLQTAFSYACMYYSATDAPQAAPYPLPEPYLDFGDVLLWQHVYDGVAVGTLHNNKERHALALVRDSALRHSRYSSIPRKRNFAADLRQQHLELIEFAWMQDHSLIIACRRLHKPPTPHHNQLVLSSDLMFYHVIPPNAPLGSPMLTMLLRERPTICHFCGVRGIQQCACPPSFKRRAPAHAERLHASQSSQQPPLSAASSSSSSSPSSPSPPSPSPSPSPCTLSLNMPPTSERFIQAWLTFCKRIFTFAHSGCFFVKVFRATTNAAVHKLVYNPSHPIPYQFVCGDRSQTLQLLSLYVRRVRLCNRLIAAESRLHAAAAAAASNAPFPKRMVSGRGGVEAGGANDEGAVAGGVTNSAEQQFLLRFDSDALHGRISDDGSSPSPSTTLTGNSPTSSIREGAQVFGLDVETSNGALQTTAAAAAMAAAAAAGVAAVRASEAERVLSSVAVASASAAASASASASASVATAAAAAAGAVGMNNSAAAAAAAAAAASGMGNRRMTTDREVRRFITCDAQNVPSCKKCGHRFPKRGNLIRHIQAVHLKLKPFICGLCSARFGYKTHLKRHQQKHQRADDVALQLQLRA